MRVINRLLISIFALPLIFGLPITQAADPALPNGPTPEFVLVRNVDLDAQSLTLEHKSRRPVSESRVKSVLQPDGTVVAQTETVTVFVEEYRASHILTHEFQLHSAGGKPLKWSDYLPQLKGELIVRPLGEDIQQPLDPAYLKLLAPETLVLAPIKKAEK